MYKLSMFFTIIKHYCKQTTSFKIILYYLKNTICSIMKIPGWTCLNAVAHSNTFQYILMEFNELNDLIKSLDVSFSIL